MAPNISEQTTAPASIPAMASSVITAAKPNSIFMPPAKTTQDNFMHNSQSDSLLFSKLPGELRNRIWRLSVLEDTAISVHVAHYKNKDGEPRSCIQIEHTLLQVCKQARHEVTDIYYLENTFRITQDFFHGRAMEVLACAMKPRAAKMTKLEVAHELKYTTTTRFASSRNMLVAINLTIQRSEGSTTLSQPLVDITDASEANAEMDALVSSVPMFAPPPPPMLCCCKMFFLAAECTGETLVEWMQRYVKLVVDATGMMGCGYVPHCWGCGGLALLGQTEGRYQL